jgi:hypothetical protein
MSKEVNGIKNIGNKKRLYNIYLLWGVNRKVKG